MIWQKILAIILALLLSDLYILAFKKILPIYERRINTQRQRNGEISGKQYPYVKYSKAFITRYSILIIVCVILGIIVTSLDLDEEYLIPLLRSMASYGIGFISIACIIVFFIGKVRRIYNQIKHDDPYYYMISKSNDENEEFNEDNEIENLEETEIENTKEEQSDD